MERIKIDINSNRLVETLNYNHSENFAVVKDVISEYTYLAYKDDVRYLTSKNIKPFGEVLTEGVDKIKSKTNYNDFVEKVANVVGRVGDDLGDMLRHAFKKGLNKTLKPLLRDKDFSYSKFQNYLKKLYQGFIDRNIQDLETDIINNNDKSLVYEFSGTVKNVLIDEIEDIDKILKSVNREIARIFIKNDKLSIKVYDKVIKQKFYKDLNKWKVTFELIFEITFTRKDEDGDFYIVYKGKDSKINDDTIDSLRNNLYKAYYRALEFIYL